MGAGRPPPGLTAPGVRAAGYATDADRCRPRGAVWPPTSRLAPRHRESTCTRRPGGTEQLRHKVDEAVHAGSERAVEAQHKRGKLTARERVEAFLDDGSFVELDELAPAPLHNFGLQDKRPYGDGVVTGYGTVDGRQVFVFAQDFTVFGGSLGEVFGEKIVKVMDMALKTGAPVVGINDSGGRADPGGRRLTGAVRRDLLPQRAGVRRDPADLADHGPVRRGCRLLTGDHRLHRHGRQDLAHVHHRSRRHQDGHRRERRVRGARRRPHPPGQERRRPLHGQRRGRTPSSSRAAALASCRPTTSRSRRSYAAVVSDDDHGRRPRTRRARFPTPPTSRTTCTT